MHLREITGNIACFFYQGSPLYNVSITKDILGIIIPRHDVIAWYQKMVICKMTESTDISHLPFSGLLLFLQHFFLQSEKKLRYTWGLLQYMYPLRVTGKPCALTCLKWNSWAWLTENSTKYPVQLRLNSYNAKHQLWTGARLWLKFPGEGFNWRSYWLESAIGVSYSTRVCN